MKLPAIAFLSALCFASCAGMKEKFSEMSQGAKNAGKKAADTANSEAAKHDPNGPWDGPKTPSQAAAAAKNAAGAAAAAGSAAARGEDPRQAAAGANSSGGSGSAGSSDAAGGSATASSTTQGSGGVAEVADAEIEDASGADVGVDGGVAEDSVDSTGEDVGSSESIGYTIDCTVPQNKPEDVEGKGTEPYPGSEAKKGWFQRTRYAQGLEMTQEVMDEREGSFLQETRTFQNGQLISCQLVWVARFYEKIDPATIEHQVDFESKTTDLPDETLKVGDVDVRCKVQRVWSRVANQESTSVVWSSTEVPFGTVKMVQETKDGPHLVYELLEFRR